MKTFGMIFTALVCAILVSNVEACNQGSQSLAVNSVVDSSTTGQLKLISPSPNPTKDSTIVGFTNTQKVTYNFFVVDVHGDTVYTMALNKTADTGSHTFTIPAGTLIPGTYFYSLQVGSAVLKKRLSVVR
jgi:hypothetical protein